MPVNKAELLEVRRICMLTTLKEEVYDYIDNYLRQNRAMNIATSILFRGIDPKYWNEAFEQVKSDYRAAGWEVERNKWSDQREDVDVDQIVIS